MLDKRGKIDKTRLAFHTDQGATDLIALLSIGAAPQGGESKWVSAVAIHNELLRRGRKVRISTVHLLEAWCQKHCTKSLLHTKQHHRASTTCYDTL